MFQKQGDEWVVICYHSKRLPASAKNFGDHKAIEYRVKSKTETPTTRLKTLLLKHQKGSEMHTSDALSRLHNLTDTPDNKDIIPLNFLQHLTPYYIEHSYSH